MTKKELSILEKVFAAEIEGALSAHGIRLFQTKAKIAKKLSEEGYLQFVQEKFQGVTISGYVLTELGRVTYCFSV